MAKISVITINYNNAAALDLTVQSVLSQDLPDMEYIIIDGGSTDGSREIIEKYADALTHWVSEPDNGVYHAMNKGIRVSTGDYLFFLNSGDTFFQSSTLRQAAAEMKDELDIYYGDVMFDEHFRNHHMTFPDTLTFGFFTERTLPHQATFTRRSLFDRVSYFNEEMKIVADWEFFTLAICKHHASYRHLHLIIANYDATGISAQPENRQTIIAEKAASMETNFPMFTAEYEEMKLLKIKHVKQLLFIRQHRFAFKILKAFMKLVLLFLPKPKPDA